MDYRVVTLVCDPENRISSTDIREAIAAGSSWHGWVPPDVACLVEACLRQTALHSRSA